MKQKHIIIHGIALAAALVLGLDACHTEQPILQVGSFSQPKWNAKFVEGFDAQHTGVRPLGWTTHRLVGDMELASSPSSPLWTVEKSASSSGNVVHCAGTKGDGSMFNLLTSPTAYPADIELEAKIHADSGDMDRGGGLMWRVNGNDYYLARWNPLEHNLRLYKVLNGERTQLQSANIDTGADGWHKLEVRHSGTHIVVEFDGVKELDCDDDSIRTGGKAGLWTKADAASSFDDFEVEWNG